MKHATINIKTDPELKKAAQELAREMGLTLSAVINGQLAQFVRDKEFRISVSYQMNESL